MCQTHFATRTFRPSNGAAHFKTIHELTSEKLLSPRPFAVPPDPTDAAKLVERNNSPSIKSPRRWPIKRGKRSKGRSRARRVKVLQANIEGLTTYLNLADHRFFRFDVLAFSETLSIRSNVIEGFDCLNVPATKPARGRPCGGLSLFIRHQIPHRLLSSTDNTIHALLTKQDISIISVYFPPNTDVEFIVDVVVSSMSHPDCGSNIILLGDFNCRIDSGDRGSLLQEALEEINLTMHSCSTTPTYEMHFHDGTVARSCIDLVFSNMAGRLSHIKVASDSAETGRKHRHVVTKWKFSSEYCGNTKVITSPTLDTSKLPQDTEALVSAALDNADVNTALQAITSAIDQAKCTKKKTLSSHRPWFDSDCIRAKQDLSALRRQHLPCHIAKAHFKRICNLKRSNYYTEQVNELIAKADVSPFSVFRKRKPYQPLPPITSLVDHLKTLFSNTEELPYSPTRLTSTTVSDFSLDEVISTFTKAPKRKAPGPDGISNSFLQQTSEALGSSWTLLFNFCFQSGLLPTLWKTYSMIFLYKQAGSMSDPSNFRGIALQCCVYKMFARLVKSRLTPAIEPQLYEHQYGFRPKRSCADAVSLVLNSIQHAFSSKKMLYCAFVDFKKAFDSVNRRLLVDKLSNFIEDPGLVNIIKAILSDNNIVIKPRACQCCGESHDPPGAVNQVVGVPQGDALSPLLFTIFINDLPQALDPDDSKEVTVLLFADDVAILSSDREAMHRALSRLAIWSQNNMIEVNSRKTKIMKFRKGGRPSKLDKFFLNGTELELVSEYKYLGVTLQTTMCFTKHVARVKTRAFAATAALKPHLNAISHQTAKLLFESKVKSIVVYGLKEIAPFLKSRDLLELDKAKTNYIRKFLCLPRSSPTATTHKLFDSDRLCVELKGKGFQFDESQFSQYLDQLKPFDNSIVSSATGFAFRDPNWKAPRRDRHFAANCAVSGFHHLLCNNRSFHFRCSECVCKFCKQSAADQDHLATCACIPQDLPSLFARLNWIRCESVIDLTP